MDFSSKRLIVAGAEILNPEHILSEYEGLYLLQYDIEIQAKYAYAYYAEHSVFCEPDSLISIAKGRETGSVVRFDMSTGENPFSELTEAVTENTEALSGPVIALIDTGAPVHPNVIESVSMIGESGLDDNGHGTRMLECILSRNPEARVLSIKAIGENGQGDVSAVFAAIQYAISRGASIINLSLSAVKKAEHAAIEAAVVEAVNCGITVVGAAGNNNRNAGFYIPGGISEAVVISACDENGMKVELSNFGDSVDYYVVSESTSEAAAVYSGLLSLGKGEADNVTVFASLNAEKPEEPKEPVVEDPFIPQDDYGEYIRSNTRTDLTGRGRFE